MKTITKKITVAVALLAFTGSAFAGDTQHKEGCMDNECASRKAADFEKEVKKAEKAHPENAALKDLATKLKGKRPSEQNAVLKAFFALGNGADETAVEKSIDQKLNDGAADKLTNAEVLRLADVLTGNRY